MIVQNIYIPEYGWHVRIYYAVTTYWADRIASDMHRIGCVGGQLERAYSSLMKGDLNTGITYSTFWKKETVMVISLTSTPAEFLNSWEHEKKHLARHIEQAYGIDPYSEEAAYLEGDIAQRMFPVAKRFICGHCRKNLLNRNEY